MSDEITYWFFARSFGYMPAQVDSLPYDRMVYFKALEEEVRKQEGPIMK